ncbi:glucose-6-phosphate isomerase [uncultured Desulfovibrio sp.]|uniref:Glucose-6-phosphate isomerase n=1 Tax=Candidatus Desulfovibrio intestinavium TaxID=2838534 RepID=A0A9D2HMH3_9BACT|nr:glucose-6-phosphate isomerase [uncultured Desulfovibrio sp.]HJA79436.1 glucose-6-phosphate isomerase [Candidatus Desulfovibrio intestinavium]
MLHQLDWSHASGGRLPAEASAPAAARAAAMAARLLEETAQGRLPFLNFPFRSRLERELPPLLPRLRARRHMLLLGIGGSALGARALQRAFAPGQDEPGHDGPCLWIADNVCEATLARWLDRLEPGDTSVVCVSKSGGTIETVAQYLLVRDWLRATLGEGWREHVLLVTDDRKGFLREEAAAHDLPSLEVPDHLGGRYSALSAVGLVPAAFLGIDWQGLLDGASGVGGSLLDAARQGTLADHPAFRLAAWAHALEACAYDQLIFFCYLPQWAAFGPWFAQLWAESLGKEGTGSQPLPATGVTDQHSINQMFLDGPRNKGCLFLSGPDVEVRQPAGQGLHFAAAMPERWQWLAGRPFGCLLDAEGLGTRMALCRSGVPLVHLRMADASPRAAGALMGLLEAMTLLTGWLNGINPLDQPAVELGKRLANARLGAPGLPEEERAMREFMAQEGQCQTF